MKRTLVTTTSILAIALVITCLVFDSVVVIGDGLYYLKVNVSSTEGNLTSVLCIACFDHRYAALVVEDPFNREYRGYSVEANPFDGSPLSVPVPITDRSSPSGRVYSRHHYRSLIVIGQMHDGRQLTKVVDIPAYDPAHEECREVNVSLP